MKTWEIQVKKKLMKERREMGIMIKIEMLVYIRSKKPNLSLILLLESIFVKQDRITGRIITELLGALFY